MSPLPITDETLLLTLARAFAAADCLCDGISFDNRQGRFPSPLFLRDHSLSSDSLSDSDDRSVSPSPYHQ